MSTEEHFQGISKRFQIRIIEKRGEGRIGRKVERGRNSNAWSHGIQFDLSTGSRWRNKKTSAFRGW